MSITAEYLHFARFTGATVWSYFLLAGTGRNQELNDSVMTSFARHG
jgi:hypothetical protein